MMEQSQMELHEAINDNSRQITIIEIPTILEDTVEGSEVKEEHLMELISIEEQDESSGHIEMIQNIAASTPKTTIKKSIVGSRNSSGKKRVSLTIEKKMEIIHRHEAGESQKSLALEFNVGRTTISDILKRKFKFLKFVSMNSDGDENLKRRRTLRRTVHKALEDQLIEWYNQLRDSGAYVSGPMISVKAQELHKELGYTGSFTASNGWLDRFKVRNGIKLCGLREVKKTESDVNAVAPFKSDIESLAQWYNLTLEQIYNADETDLFWRMLPNPTQDVNEVKSSVRAYRERMTLLCCANAAGTHKLPLVCIGRGKRSRTFTSQELKSMPIHYYSQETAWMDSEIFKNWFQTIFIPEVRQHLAQQGLPENALLLIDRNSSHPDDQHLRSPDNIFFIQYFPAKVKSIIQPMEQGLIHDMKLHYRQQILNELIAQNSTIADYYKTLTVKEAIRIIANAWDQISTENIQKCFSKIFPIYMDVSVPDSDTPSMEMFMDLISKIPECVENNYNEERLKFWLACDEAEPIRDRNSLTLYNFKDELTDDSLKIYDNYEEEVPHAIEIITASNLKSTSDLQQEEMIHDDTEIDILSQPPQEVLEHITKQSDEEFLYEENLNEDVTCEQAVEAMDVVLNFMKNDSESRYRDVVFLTELKKKLKRRLSDFTEMKDDKEEYL